MALGRVGGGGGNEIAITTTLNWNNIIMGDVLYRECFCVVEDWSDDQKASLCIILIGMNRIGQN